MLAMKARYERERDILRSQIREMEKRHRDELRVAGALPEVSDSTIRVTVTVTTVVTVTVTTAVTQAQGRTGRRSYLADK